MNYCIESETGDFRKQNQDKAALFSKGDWTLAILCDGMGGHFGGEKCAEIAIESLRDYFTNNFPENMQDSNKASITKWFNNAISYIKKQMDSFVEDEPGFKDMGTTLTAALIFNISKHIYIFNVGDSRTYAYNGYMHQITRDQNYLSELLDMGIPYSKASKNINSEKLVSCLGPNKFMTVAGYDLKSGYNVKYLLLTSDGCHDYVSKPQMEVIIQNPKKSIQEKVKLLIKTAKKNFSKDNITVLLVEL
ncbi:PP2C family protein-serine/threonine phosphatase [Mycoplasma struthionis]|nr:protein phosphatase 2C domain-containing protein [Mycoplasma struthionis]